MSDMSDELLSLRHERALELLQKPEIKEFFEDRNKRFINITALKEWEEAGELFEEDDEILAFLEYMKREAHKLSLAPDQLVMLLELADVTLPMEDWKYV
ncbi:unnamed protein product [Rhizophagus irregularis]|uniref:Uncharacterized protein n=1 Tax=Rhizophagus irregularis TaxID=588596 RepID=A0A2N1N993_9GLOM|nr:hypothetical protein RhiirC2_779793 [Rhizophagus irregularis]CAB5311399.1 unnamed protein product [Rhizophagus irregularis]